MSSAKGMIYTIQNKDLKVKINSLGAELWSIQDGDGLEYLWQGAPEYWKDRGVTAFSVYRAPYRRDVLLSWDEVCYGYPWVSEGQRNERVRKNGNRDCL